MNKISAEIIADSINEDGQRLTTFVLTFPRMILAELNTHRAFSRNSASSRAIPFSRMVQMVEDDPFIPIAFQKDHKGMQGTEYFTGDAEKYRIKTWIKARNAAVKAAKRLNRDQGVTKQLANRLLEPFMWHKVIVTATDFGNFFGLRCPVYQMESVDENGDSKKITAFSRRELLRLVKPYRLLYKQVIKFTEQDWREINIGQAEIHMQALAEQMYNAYFDSNPKLLKANEYHIPFGDQMDQEMLEQVAEATNSTVESVKVKIAVARCARISYTTMDGEIDYVKDVQLHDLLLSNGHMSPFEHIGTPVSKHEDLSYVGNFKGFVQLRKMVEEQI